MALNISKAFAFIIFTITLLVGIGSFLTFLLYLYIGLFSWVDLGLDEAVCLVFDTLISVAFFLQHSLMIRRPFRQRVSTFIPEYYHGAAYTVASGLFLFAFLLLWQGSEVTLFEAQGLIAGVMRALYCLSLLGICWGMWALRTVDMFGLAPILKHFRAGPSPSTPFTIRGPYCWVRHPLYTFMIVLFWSCPLLTLDRLLFNILWTAWVVVGTILEERDLVADFGDAYRHYQATVPMLIPRSVFPVDSVVNPANQA